MESKTSKSKTNRKSNSSTGDGKGSIAFFCRLIYILKACGSALILLWNRKTRQSTQLFESLFLLRRMWWTFEAWVTPDAAGTLEQSRTFPLPMLAMWRHLRNWRMTTVLRRNQEPKSEGCTKGHLKEGLSLAFCVVLYSSGTVRQWQGIHNAQMQVHLAPLTTQMWLKDK